METLWEETLTAVALMREVDMVVQLGEKVALALSLVVVLVLPWEVWV